MLDPDYLFNVADDIVELYEQLNTFGINDICRRLVNADFQLTGSAEWQYYLLQQTGMSRNEINKKIAQITKKSEKEIKAIFEESSYRSYNADMSVYEKAGITPLPFSQSERMLQILDATYRATLGELHNLTRTTADASQELLINTLNETQWKVETGMQSKNQAIAEAIEKVAEDGINVLYSGGVRRSLESVVRMCITTGINQACSQISLKNCESMGTDLVLTSSHSGARTGQGYKGHVNWQGRVFSLSGASEKYPSFKQECGYGLIQGICGVNCRHSFLPYIEGVSHNPFERYDSQEDREKYDKQQKQRRMERNIRTTKRQLQAMQESINAAREVDVKEVLQEKYDRLAYKLQNQRANYNKFCEDNNLVPQAERMKVARFSRSEAQKAVWGAKRYEKLYSEEKQTTRGDNQKMNLSDKENVQDYRPISKSKQSFVEQRGEKELVIRKIENSTYKGDICISDAVTIKPKQMHNIEKSLNSALKIVGGNDNLPMCIIISTVEMQTGAVCSYHAAKNVLYIDSVVGDKKKLLELQRDMACPDNPLSTYVHEFIHWKDAQEYLVTSDNGTQSEYLKDLRSTCKIRLDKLEKQGYNIYDISKYANKTYHMGKYDETWTEYRVLKLLGKDK